MRDRLPVLLENNELPYDKFKKNERSKSYGYVNFIYLLSLIITLGSILTIIFLGK